MLNCLPRRAVTVVEVLVALVVAGGALALVASISLRQQRLFRDLSETVAVSGQLREASAVLPIDLRMVAPPAGDLRTGESRDTSVEFRSTIASAVVCDTSGGLLVLAPAVAGETAFASYLTSVEAGDTAWVLTPAVSWLASGIRSVGTAAGGQCAAGGPTLTGAALATTRITLGLSNAGDLSTLIGLPLRVTRPSRYSLYRASDGSWYLGQRDWNNSTSRFNTIQPVAGPFMSATSGGLAFRYLDSTGTVLSQPVASPQSVAAIRADLRSQTRDAARVLGASSGALTGTRRTDSSSVVILLRNAR